MFGSTLQLERAPRSERARARQVERLARALDEADAVVVGAGAGLSTAAGLMYDGPRFERWLGDFGREHGFADMYSGGFFPFGTEEERWAYWSRFIWCNRYEPAPEADALYRRVLALVRDRDYFVLTTNVDHRFQLAGADKQRLFYTQGDYGLWQCSEPCHTRTYDNKAQVQAMMEAQGYVIDPDGRATLPTGGAPAMRIPTELVPRCPVCGKPMSMNLRADETFVEDEGWHAASARWNDFQRRHQGMRTLYLELGVGWNTPGIIKLPFWRACAQNPRAMYACLNRGEAVCPRDLGKQAILIDGDIAETFGALELELGLERARTGAAAR